MPNYVKNRVKMEGIANLPLFREVDGKKHFDFNKLIPMPAELEMEEGSTTEENIIYYLTERCSIPVQDLQGDKASMARALVRNMFSAAWHEEVFRRVREKMAGASEAERDIAYDKGRQYISNFMEYGFTTWYGWCSHHWGTKWNAMDTKILDEDTIEFDTAWSNPDPIMEKLGEMYPGIHVEHWWADEDVGSNTGHRVMFDGGVVENRFDGDSDAYSIYTMLWGESKCVYLDDSGLIHFKDCDTCDGCG